MPRLCEFYGILIYMYFRDHHPPHFHALYAGSEAVVQISDGAVIVGSLPRTALRLVQDWCELHRAELEANWLRAMAPEPLVAIEPLQ